MHLVGPNSNNLDISLEKFNVTTSDTYCVSGVRIKMRMNSVHKVERVGDRHGKPARINSILPSIEIIITIK